MRIYKTNSSSLVVKLLFSYILPSIIIVLIAIAFGFFLLTISYLIPTERMVQHLLASSDILQREGNYYTWSGEPTMTDGFTDSIMLGHAVYNGGAPLLHRVLLNPERQTAEAGNSRIETILSALEPDAKTFETNYARYWHGYLIFLKPMLFFFDYSGIRIWLMLIQAFLLIICSALIAKRLGILYSIILFSAILFMPPVTAALSLQFADIYIIMLLMIISIFVLEKRLIQSHYSYWLFLFCGISVAYFDLLTCPVVALGVPLVFFILLCPSEKRIQNLFKCSIGWGIGYSGMWSGKWFLANVFTGTNVISEAKQAAIFRSGTNYGAYKRYEGFRRVLVCLDKTPIEVVFYLLFIILIVCLIFQKNRHFSHTLLISLLLLASYPFIWDMVFLNHTALHWWMTWRNMAVMTCSICALFIAVLVPPPSIQS